MITGNRVALCFNKAAGVPPTAMQSGLTELPRSKWHTDGSTLSLLVSDSTGNRGTQIECVGLWHRPI